MGVPGLGTNTHYLWSSSFDHGGRCVGNQSRQASDCSVVNNTDETRYLVNIEQADGQSDLNSNANSGDAGDVYPSGTENAFTANTTPNSRAYDGSDSKIEVIQIARSGNLITATIASGGAVAQAWYNSKMVLRTYATHHSENAWASIQDLGWRKIETGSPDGVTNMLVTLAEAQANGYPMNVYADDQKIYRLYQL